MYTLYARPFSGSAAVEALLTILKVPFEIVDVLRGADNLIPEWFYKINPLGQVPALKLPDGSLLTESAAIMIYLADQHAAAGLAPSLTSSQRAEYLRAMIFMAASPYNSDLLLYYPERYTTDPASAASIKAKASERLMKEFSIFEGWLGQGPFILGNKISAADIYAAMLFAWSDDVPALFAKHPKLKKLYDAVTANPAIRKVWDRNEMP